MRSRTTYSAQAEIRKEIEDLMAGQPIPLDASVIARAWKIEDPLSNFPSGISLIIAAARVG